MAAVLLLASVSGRQAAPGQTELSQTGPDLPGPNTEVAEAGLVLRPLPRSDPAGDDEETGAEVEAISPGGPAAKAWIAAGDVIVRIGTQPVGTPEDVAAEIRLDRKSGRIAETMLVMRKDHVYYAVISLNAR
jgi:S1-C subfamily serine protease